MYFTDDSTEMVYGAALLKVVFLIILTKNSFNSNRVKCEDLFLIRLFLQNALNHLVAVTDIKN